MFAIITVGVSASGKSTWARNFIHDRLKLDGEQWVDVNRDWERRCILFEKSERQIDKLVWRNWKWKWEDEVTKRCDDKIVEAAVVRNNIIISDTNLNKGRREALQRKLEDLGYTVQVKTFPVSFEEACRRDAERENGVGYQVIAKQFEQWNAEFADRHEKKDGLPHCVLVDIDGTIAHMYDRGPFEWNKVGQDKVDNVVDQLVWGLFDTGKKIVFLSGRDGCCWKETQDWIDNNTMIGKYGTYELFMRGVGDSRRDDVVKGELFFDHIQDRYNVFCVLDDRPQMIRKWHSMGLKVLAVANPYIEF